MNTPGQQPKVLNYNKLVFHWLKIGDTLVLGDKDYDYKLRIVSRLIVGLEVEASWREASAADEETWSTQPGAVRLIGGSLGAYRSDPERDFREGVSGHDDRPYPFARRIPRIPNIWALEIGRNAWLHLGQADSGQQLAYMTQPLTRLGIARDQELPPPNNNS